MKKTAPYPPDRLTKLVRRAGVLRSGDAAAHGIHPEYLRRLCARGQLARVGRGLYVVADAAPTEMRTLAEACKRVPHGVVCLLSALQFHGLTTQLPFEVWMAVDRDRTRRTRRPADEYPPLRLVLFSGLAMTSGVQQHQVEGVAVKVYSPAKTVADCFKYRRKIGQDVALEGLRDCWRQRRATMEELWAGARTCRVANVMRPYLEFLT